MKVGYWPFWSEWPLALSLGIALVVAGAAGWLIAWEQWQMLVLLTFVAAVPIAIRWPVISTFGPYAFLVPFDFVAVFGGGSLTKLLGVMTAAILLATAVMGRRMVRPPAAVLWWALFLLWAALSAAWAVIAPSSVLSGSLTILSLFLLYAVAVSFRVSEKDIAWICALTVLGGMIAAGWGVMTGAEQTYESSGRGTMAVGEQGVNPNNFAASLILPLALAIGGFMGARIRFGRVLSLVAVGIIGLAIFFAMSRGVLLGLAAVALVFLYRFGVRWQVLLVAALLVGAGAIMPQTFFDRITGVFTGEDSTGAGRTKIWAIGLEALRKHGLIGAGFRSFMEVYGQTVPVAPSLRAKGAHNTYLGTWVELGVVGLVLLLGAVACHLLAVRRVRSSSGRTAIVAWATEAACYGGLVMAFFGDVLFTKYFWLSWIMLAWGVQVSERQALQSGAEQPKQA